VDIYKAWYYELICKVLNWIILISIRKLLIYTCNLPFLHHQIGILIGIKFVLSGCKDDIPLNTSLFIHITPWKFYMNSSINILLGYWKDYVKSIQKEFRTKKWHMVKKSFSTICLVIQKNLNSSLCYLLPISSFFSLIPKSRYFS